MITFAALPKPFIGHIGTIQRNAIGSWLQLEPRPEIVLFGDEEGTAEVAKELGVTHVPEVDLNEHGTPMLPQLFRKVESMSSDNWICYINADILLVSDFMPGFKTVADSVDQCLMVGWCTNLDQKELIDFSDPQWEEKLMQFNAEKGTPRGNTSDYFVYKKDMYPHYPPLVLGRAYFDIWVIYEARRLKIPVVDATKTVTAIHQNHFYQAAAGETFGHHNADEAQQNLDIIGSKTKCYRVTEATHKLTTSGLRRNWIGYFLVRPWIEWLRRKVMKPVKFCCRPLKPLLRKLGLLQ